MYIRRGILNNVVMETRDENLNLLPTDWDAYYIFESETDFDKCSVIRDFHETDAPDLLFPKEHRDVLIAFEKLIMLRDRYNGEWKPNWSDLSLKYVINNYGGEIRVSIGCYENKVLAFETSEMAERFLTNFRDIIEIAKSLI